MGEKKFDFLREIVANIPDHQTEEDGGDNSGPSEPKKPRVPRGSVSFGFNHCRS